MFARGGRRSLVKCARLRVVFAVFLSLCGFVGEVSSQNYPTRPVRYILPSSAGGGGDFLGRIMAEELTQALGQQVIVDNRAGAAGNIGAEIAARSTPDGHTVFQCSATLAINATLYRKLGYDLVRDFIPVSLIVIQPNVVIANARVPAKTIPELIKLAKDQPGTINYASAGPGSASFFAAELLKSMAGIDMLHVPYKGGGPALTSIVSGESSVMFAPYPPARPHIEAGRLRALAVTSATRLPALPQYPTVAEAGLTGYESNNWYGLMVPAMTRKPIVAKLHSTIRSIMGKPEVNKRLSDLGYVPAGNRPEEYAKFVKSEIAAHAKLIRQTGLVAK